MLMKLIQLLMGRGGQSQLMSVLPALLGASGGLGGLSGLIGKLQGAGGGDAASSWISKGKNQRISPGVLKQALGPDQLNRIAAKAGISQRQAASGLSKLLPDVVDKLSPDGELPPDDAVEGALGDIPQLLGR